MTSLPLSEEPYEQEDAADAMRRTALRNNSDSLLTCTARICTRCDHFRMAIKEEYASRCLNAPSSAEKMKISQSHEFQMTHKVLLAKKDQPHRIKATMYRTKFYHKQKHQQNRTKQQHKKAADDAA